MAIELNTRFSHASIVGSASQGGWEMSGTFFNDHDEVIWGRECVFFVRPEGGGKWEEFETEAINGSMVPQSLVFDRRQSATSVQVSTSHLFLANAGLQGIYFVDDATPENPHQITDLNLGKIVQHIIWRHTNISTLVPNGWVDISRIDTFFSTSVDVYTVRQTNSIWQAIAQIASNEFYVRYFTKRDELVYEPHPQFRATPLTPVATITANDMLGQPEVIYRNDVKTDQALLYALTDTGAILQAEYPANVGTEGRRQKFTNIRCNSQARLDQLAERAYKFQNRDIDFRFTVAGPWGAYFELYDRLNVSYVGTDRNGVNINWSEKKFYIQDIRINRLGRFNATTEFVVTEEVL